MFKVNRKSTNSMSFKRDTNMPQPYTMDKESPAVQFQGWRTRTYQSRLSLNTKPRGDYFNSVLAMEQCWQQNAGHSWSSPDSKMVNRGFITYAMRETVLRPGTHVQWRNLTDPQPNTSIVNSQFLKTRNGFRRNLKNLKIRRERYLCNVPWMQAIIVWILHSTVMSASFWQHRAVTIVVIWRDDSKDLCDARTIDVRWFPTRWLLTWWADNSTSKVKLTCLTECPTDNESLVSPTSMPMSKQRLSMFQERLYTMTWSSCRSRIS